MKRYLLILILPIISFFTFQVPQVKARIKEIFTGNVSLQAAEWTSVEGAVDVIKQTLESSNKEQLAHDLYALMTEDFKELVSWENFQDSITETNLKVLSTNIVTEGDEFAEVKMRLESSMGEKNFTVYLKKEDGKWRIFGTEEE